MVTSKPMPADQAFIKRAFHVLLHHQRRRGEVLTMMGFLFHLLELGIADQVAAWPAAAACAG